MKSICISVLAMAATGGAAVAGGIDRSGQDVSVIFEQGTYVTLSFGSVNPTVSGLAGGIVSSGDMAPSYSQVSLGYRQSVGDRFDIALILDQPYGADVSYPTGTGYPIAGTTAELNSSAITLLGQYAVSDRFSVLAGLRQQAVDGNVFITGGYTIDISDNSGVGYVLGAAYEIPDIAMRVAVIYNSPIEHDVTGTELGGPVSFTSTTPQSVNLTAQSGIAANTLLFGSVRWVDWTSFDITPPGYALLNGGASLVDYDNDTYSYTLGVGRKFSDAFSGSVAVGYEKTIGDPVSNLGPTDGYFSVQVGGRYMMDNVTISGGLRYVKIGDATTKTIGGDFSGNSAIGVGVQIGVAY